MGIAVSRLSGVEWVPGWRAWWEPRTASPSVRSQSSLGSLSAYTTSRRCRGAPSSRSVRWSAHGSNTPFFVGGVVTMAYDLTLWWLYRRVKPPEEVAEG